VLLVESRRGKGLRAEPIVGMYEKEMVWHVKSKQHSLETLEDEMVSWVPGIGASPNRVDALVHGITDLVRRFAGPMQIADPNRVLRGLQFPSGDFRRRNLRGLS
jgi:phage terminase large subunit-like protein